MRERKDVLNNEIVGTERGITRSDLHREDDDLLIAQSKKYP